MSEQGMRHLLDNLTKPVGSLGLLEDAAMRLSSIQGKVPPKIDRRGVFVIAGDHGITEEGVSLYPKGVTLQMALNFLSGGAAINSLASHCGFSLHIVDAGIEGNFDDSRIIDMKVGNGTRNFARESSMTDKELEMCLGNGKKLADMAQENGYDLVAIGDMGIGNTSSAAAMLIAAGMPEEAIIDKGTGISDETLARKREIICNAVKKHAPFSSPSDILIKTGGFELATMTGLVLGLSGKGIPCVLDGFPVTSAAYMATLIEPSVASFLFAGHRSKVKGHETVLRAMGLKPLVDFEMRLGEGTGAVIGGFVLTLAAAFCNEMASFDDAGVSRSKDDEERY